MTEILDRISLSIYLSFWMGPANVNNLNFTISVKCKIIPIFLKVRENYLTTSSAPHYEEDHEVHQFFFC